MLQNLERIKKQLSELAAVLNAFKSEAVQLRLLEFVLGGEPEEQVNNRATGARVTKKSRRRRATTPLKSGAGSPVKKKKLSSGTGARATLNQLLTGPFFDKPRTIKDVVDHCRHNLARTFKANDFSGTLARMVRNHDLTRKKNANNQYEYKKP